MMKFKIRYSVYALNIILFAFCFIFTACKPEDTDTVVSDTVSLQNKSPELSLPNYPIDQLAEAYSRFFSYTDSLFSDTAIIIDGAKQFMYLISGPASEVTVIRQYSVSTSKYGFSSKRGSNQTPLGVHEIASKYGADAPLGMCFYDRRPTGEIATIFSDTTNIDVDPVTSRIIWLKGLEKNNLSSYWRFVYIHGTHEEGLIGTPQSKGCIRMLNKDVIELFNLVKPGTLVNIINPLPILEKDK